MFHFTQTYSSWLNQFEIWFSKLPREVIDCGIFTSVADLRRKIMRDIRLYGKIGYREAKLSTGEAFVFWTQRTMNTRTIEPRTDYRPSVVEFEARSQVLQRHFTCRTGTKPLRLSH